TVFGVEVGDLRVLLDRLARLVQARVEVADLLDRFPVARVVVDDLLEERDRLVELAGFLELVGVLLDLDRVDLRHVRLAQAPRFSRTATAVSPGTIGDGSPMAPSGAAHPD